MIRTVDDARIEYLSKMYIEPVVMKVRQRLLKEYPDVLNFTGLCDTAYDIFQEEFMNSLNSEMQKLLKPKIKFYHGEMRHTPSLKSQDWTYEHTWLHVELEGMIIYVDITSQQFKDIIPDIPNYYISPIKPKWYYDDRENPRWNGIINKINENTIFQYKSHHLGVIEFIQYIMWGSLSDVIYTLTH